MRASPVVRIATVAAALALGIVTFVYMMSAPLNYDEEQYVAAGYFARTLAPYRDFLLLQPPVTTRLLAAALELTPAWHLLVARSLAWAAGFIALLTLASLLMSLGTGRMASIALVVGAAASPFFDVPLSTARNDLLAVCFVLLGLRCLLLEGFAITPSRARIAAAGMLLALAAATRYPAVFAAPVVLVTATLVVLRQPDGGRRQAVRLASWFVAGALAGSAPVLFELATNPRSYVDGTVGFHRVAPFDWYADQGRGHMLGAAGKVRSLARNVPRGGNASLLIVAAFGLLGAFIARERPAVPRPTLVRQAMLLLPLLAAAAAFAFVPSPSLMMYWTLVAAIGALVAGAAYALGHAAFPPALRATVLVLAVVPAVLFIARKERWERAFDAARWTPVQAHALAHRVAGLLAIHGAAGHVATLYPVTVLDANEVRPEFATGPFFFRSGHAFSRDDTLRLNAVGPGTLGLLFAADPPAAVVGAFRANRQWREPMDLALTAFAEREGYRLVADDLSVPGYAGGRLWVRPPR